MERDIQNNHIQNFYQEAKKAIKEIEKWEMTRQTETFRGRRAYKRRTCQKYGLIQSFIQSIGKRTDLTVEITRALHFLV